MNNYSSAAERNQTAIYEQLCRWVSEDACILEVGSGSGQHAIHCAQAWPKVIWQCSDRPDYFPGLRVNIQKAKFCNMPMPLLLDVLTYAWESAQYDVIYTANTLHIMNQEEVDYFISHVHQGLHFEGKFILYGPFNYNNDYTSASNRAFDALLRQRNGGSCIKSFESINQKLIDNQLELLDDVAMPANNRLIVWQRPLK